MRRPLVLVILLAITAAGSPAGAAGPAPAPPADPDKRQVLKLPPDERHLVLQEMRSFVLAIKEITAGLAERDMPRVAESARRMGSEAASAIPPRVVRKLPEPFRRMAGKVHKSFDRLALDAETMGDRGLALEQLGRLMGQCVACHETYRIRTAPAQAAQ